MSTIDFMSMSRSQKDMRRGGNHGGKVGEAGVSVRGGEAGPPLPWSVFWAPVSSPGAVAVMRLCLLGICSFSAD